MEQLKLLVNRGGIPYLSVKEIQVNSDNVTLNLGFGLIPAVGEIIIRLNSAIPEGTTGSLPVQLTINKGTPKALTSLGGTAITAADIPGPGIIKIFYDRCNNILQAMNV